MFGYRHSAYLSHIYDELCFFEALQNDYKNNVENLLKVFYPDDIKTFLELADIMFVDYNNDPSLTSEEQISLIAENKGKYNILYEKLSSKCKEIMNILACTIISSTLKLTGDENIDLSMKAIHAYQIMGIFMLKAREKRFNIILPIFFTIRCYF